MEAKLHVSGIFTNTLPKQKGARGMMAAALFSRGSAAQTYPTEALAT